MKDKTQKNPNEEFLQALYKNAKMGSESIASLLPKVKEERFRQDLTTQLTGYESFAGIAANRLQNLSSEAKKPNFFAKIPAQAGIAANTLLDDSIQHLAELMINGSTMGIINMTEQINTFSQVGCLQNNLSLGNEVIAFEQKNIDHMKSYL